MFQYQKDQEYYSKPDRRYPRDGYRKESEGVYEEQPQEEHAQVEREDLRSNPSDHTLDSQSIQEKGNRSNNLRCSREGQANIQALITDDLHTSSLMENLNLEENEQQESECTLSVVAENDFDQQLQSEVQDEEFTSTQQLIQMCQEREQRNISNLTNMTTSTATQHQTRASKQPNGQGGRVVTIKHSEQKQQQTQQHAQAEGARNVQRTVNAATHNMSVLLDFNDEATTGGDRSMLSEETHSPFVRPQQNAVVVIDCNAHTAFPVLCELKFQTACGLIEVRLRDNDILILADITRRVCELGLFRDPEMQEALQIYLHQSMEKA